MNIDLKTQFRVILPFLTQVRHFVACKKSVLNFFRLGVKRVPILCSECKKQMVLYGDTNSRALQLYNLYRIVTISKAKRRQRKILLTDQSSACRLHATRF
jgi:hypothetical protein